MRFTPTFIIHDIQVQVDKDRKLIVSGERKQEEMDVNWRQQKQERRFGAFQRNFQLPEDADVSKIQGKAENGVLTITISKIPKEDIPSDSTSIPIY
jgi:HSP20 family protein